MRRAATAAAPHQRGARAPATTHQPKRQQSMRKGCKHHNRWFGRATEASGRGEGRGRGQPCRRWARLSIPGRHRAPRLTHARAPLPGARKRLGALSRTLLATAAPAAAPAWRLGPPAVACPPAGPPLPLARRARARARSCAPARRALPLPTEAMPPAGGGTSGSAAPPEAALPAAAQPATAASDQVSSCVHCGQGDFTEPNFVACNSPFCLMGAQGT